MKKWFDFNGTIITLCVLGILTCLIMPGYSGNKNLNFAWNQTLPSPNDLQGWGLYQASTPGGTYTKIMDIVYTAPLTTYTATKLITVPDGAVTILYFTIDAVDTSGNRSAKSNEVSASIDFQPPGTPITLTVTVTTP